MYEEGPGYKIASVHEKPLLEKLFKGKNKYLFIILLLMLCLSGFMIFQYFKKSTRHSSSLSPAVKIQTNIDIFNITKLQFIDSSDIPNISQGRFYGQIKKIQTSNESIIFTVEGKIAPFEKKKIDFIYPSDKSSLINIYSSSKKDKQITIADISIGDDVYIDETIDYSKQYPDCLIRIDICPADKTN